MVHCSKCGGDFPSDRFYKSLLRGKTGTCKECHRKACTGWTDIHREGWLEYKRKFEKRRREERYDWFREYERKRTLKRYGVDQAWYDAKLAEQGHVCAICKKPESRKHHARDLRVFMLGVDHKHDDSKKARGLLCQRCNRQLHTLEDSGWFEKAIQYLKTYEGDLQ